MEFSKTIKMAPPPVYNFDWTAIGEWIVSVIGIVIAFLGFTNKWFKDKVQARAAFAQAEKEGKMEFIQNVVIATVKATLDSELKGIKQNIDKLFEFREDDRNHNDSQFKELMREIKK